MNLKKSSFSLIAIFALLLTIACTNSSVGEAQTTEIKQITVEQAKQAVDGKDVQFIDVRTVEEYESGHAPKAANFPLDSLEKDLAKLDKNKPVYLICQSGARSQKGAQILQKNGFKDLYNIKGGTSAWIGAGYETEQ